MNTLRLGDLVRLLASVLVPVVDAATGAVSVQPDTTIWTVVRHDGDLVLMFVERPLGTVFKLVHRAHVEVTYRYPHKEQPVHAPPHAG